MGLLIRLGLKNIGRNRMRSILTISAVVLCSGGLTIYSVFFDGVMDMMIRSMTDSTGHVRLIHEKIAKKERLNTGYYFVGDVDKTVAKLKKLPGVTGVAPRIQLGGFLDHKGKQTPSSGMGVDPKAEEGALRLKEKIVAGEVFSPKGKEILLGMELSERLKAGVGSSIVILGRTVEGSLSALKLKVRGIVNFGNALQNKTFIVSLPTAQYILDIEGQASSILVYGKNIWNTDKLIASVRKAGLPKDVIAQSWLTTPLARQMVPIANVMVYVLGGIIVFIGGIGLLNTMTMSVIERKSEVGIMMALGLTPGRVASIFLFEGLVFGLIGAILGVGLAMLGSIPLVTTGISMPAEQMSKFPIAVSSTFKGMITANSIIVGFVVGLLCTVFGSLWPSYKASQMEPVDALRRGA